MRRIRTVLTYQAVLHIVVCLLHARTVQILALTSEDQIGVPNRAHLIAAVPLIDAAATATAAQLMSHMASKSLHTFSL
jgi:hypothetical protein